MCYYKKLFLRLLILCFFKASIVFAADEHLDNLKPLEKYDSAPKSFHKGTETKTKFGAPRLLDAKERDKKVFFFESIDFQGCTVLSRKTQERLVQPYLRQKLCINDINGLISATHAAYNNAGYVLEDVYFNKESFRTPKHLVVFLVEPRVQGLRLIEDKKRGRRINNLLDVNSHQVLKLTDLLCASDILDQLDTASCNFRLNTNPERTWHAAEFSIKKDKKCILGFDYDNQGSEDTGRDNCAFEARFEDVLGLFEQWRFRQSTTLKPFNKRKYSQMSLVSLSVPYRRWRATLWGAFERNATPSPGLRGYRTLEATQLGADLRYALSRTWTSGTYIGGTIEHYSKLQWSGDGAFWGLFSGDVTKYVLWASHFRYMLGGVVSGKLSYSQGIHASEMGMSRFFDKKFKKVNIEGAYRRSFLNRWTWTLSGKAQFGQKKLYSHEKFSLGGMSTVRGFVDSQYKADRGYFVRNDLEYALFNLFATRFFVGYDYGRLSPTKADGLLREKSLQSICCGVKLNVKDINFEMLVARPIHTVISNRYTFLFGINGEF